MTPAICHLTTRRLLRGAYLLSASLFLLGVGTQGSLITAYAGTQAQAQRAVEGFDIMAEPTPSDWSHFIKSPEPRRMKLWDYQVKRGKRLKDWSWGWRLGWVRTCRLSHQVYCAEILRQALFDKALVVRAEAATQLGRRHEGSRDANTIRLLTKAFADPRNLRGGKPLFVQNRILFSLRQIGGNDAMASGRALATQHRESMVYWARLEAAEKAAL